MCGPPLGVLDDILSVLLAILSACTYHELLNGRRAAHVLEHDFVVALVEGKISAVGDAQRGLGAAVLLEPNRGRAVEADLRTPRACVGVRVWVSVQDCIVAGAPPCFTSLLVSHDKGERRERDLPPCHACRLMPRPRTQARCRSSPPPHTT